MIKINLARRKGTGTGTGATGVDSTESHFEIHDAGASAQKGALVKLVLMFAFVGGLMFYENQNVTSYQAEMIKQSAKITELQTDLEGKRSVTSGMEVIEKSAQVLEQKLAIMKKLSRVRLREVKALDYIQSVVPEKIWFSNIVFDDNKLVLQGYAVSDDDLNELTKGLENSVQFSNVIILQATDARVANSSFKQFEISCNTEVEN